MYLFLGERHTCQYNGITWNNVEFYVLGRGLPLRRFQTLPIRGSGVYDGINFEENLGQSGARGTARPPVQIFIV